MTEGRAQSRAQPWTPTRGVRIAAGLLSGFGAVGVSGALSLIGTFIDVDLRLIDPSPLILVAPVIVVAGFAGAVLRDWDAVVAVAAGAVASPVAAMFAVDGSCDKNLWAAVALAAIAAYALVIAGVAAFVGSLIGRESSAPYEPHRGVVALIVVGTIGVLGWIVVVLRQFGCP